MPAASPDAALGIKPPEEEDRDLVCSAWHESRTRGSRISDLKKEFQALTSQRHLTGPLTCHGLCVKAHRQSSTVRAPRRPLPSFSFLRPSTVGGGLRLYRRPVCDFHTRFCLVVAGPTQSPGSPMRLEAAARMDLFRKLWKARKLIVVVFIPLSLLPLPLIHPTSVSTSKIKCLYNYKYRNIKLTFAKKS